MPMCLTPVRHRRLERSAVSRLLTPFRGAHSGGEDCQIAAWCVWLGVVGTQKRKKTDYEALNSAFMRIPNMTAAAARHLIDAGVRQIYDLVGRSPEVLFEEAARKRPELPADTVRYFRMAVYYAETEAPEQRKLHPDAWPDAAEHPRP